MRVHLDARQSLNLPANTLDLIGNTPIVKLTKISAAIPSLAKENIHLFAKLEFLNPSGSVKDRMAKFIVDEAEREGLLKPGGIIVENSSGNTGASLAMICAIKGYKCIITMPDKMSNEKKILMEGFGAEVIVTPTDVPAENENSYYSVAKRIAKERNNVFYPDQYNNSKNIEAHYRTTGPEIWQQMHGQIDMVVAGIGTGGTLSGVARFLKQQNPQVKIIAVDPIGSIFYDYFKTKTLIKPHGYKVEGIGEDFIVKAMDFDVVDDVLQVNDKDSFLMARRLAKEEGLFVGGSSGSAVHVALQRAETLANDFRNKKDYNIVVILPDSGNRYLSKFYNDDWMRKYGFI